MAGTDSGSFHHMRIYYLDNIAESLAEARELMMELNSNLQVWAERTTQLEHLAQVWTAFQNRLASLSLAFGHVLEEKPQAGKSSSSLE